MEKHKPLIIGISGGSGSGKTTVSKAIIDYFSGKSIAIIAQDSYYKDQSHKTFEERLETNYDHPFAFDNELLAEHLQQLMDGNSIDIPVYDYSKHTRSDETIHQETVDVVILEGILVLDNKKLRDLMDIKVFVDTDADVRIIRRIKRDMEERGRSLDSVITQYLTVVKKMHDQFIEPSKRHAHVIIPEGGENQVAIDLIITKIKSIFNKKIS